ncbi:uncharacterized protein At5g48480-like [Zingiber officinale]|nr:uncharacterized protein At5g48480-like [Zingiber officinale]
MAATATQAGLFGFKPQVMVPGGKAEAAVKFYKAAFGAEELRRVSHPKRKADQDLPLIISSELKIGSSFLLVGDRFDEGGEDGSAQSGGGVMFRLEAEDVAEVVKKAVAAGAVVVGEVAEDESGIVATVKDPYSVVWVIAAAVKSADPEA